MPIDYAISIDLNVAIARWTGAVVIEEYREMFAAYVQDPNYTPGRPKICDFSGMTTLDADFARIWSVLTMANSHEVPGAPTTVCVTYAPDETNYGLARMYQSLAENAGGIQVAVYRHEAGVLGHLKLPGQRISELHQHGTFLPPLAPVS